MQGWRQPGSDDMDGETRWESINVRHARMGNALGSGDAVAGSGRGTGAIGARTSPGPHTGAGSGTIGTGRVSAPVRGRRNPHSLPAAADRSRPKPGRIVG